MSLEVPLSLEPMESVPVESLPAGKGWQYEPKWDGFRCLAFRDGNIVHLQSRNQKPLNRYFTELEQALRALPVPRFGLDGEIMIREEPFEMLQLRLHPAAQLAKDYPVTFVAFDLLADERGRSLLGKPFSERRARLTLFSDAQARASSS